MELEKTIFKHAIPTNVNCNYKLESTIKENKIDSLHVTNDDLLHVVDKAVFASSLRDNERLKVPLYRKNKETNQFKPISWELAFRILIKHIGQIYENNAMFLPLAWLKGTANNGIHHFVVDEFFASLGRTTKIIPANYYETASNLQLYEEDFESYETITDASVVFLWGENTALTNKALLQKIQTAKSNGALIITIDPIRTLTAKISDLHIPIYPNSDCYFIALLIKKIIEQTEKSILLNSLFKPFLDDLQSLSTENLLAKCQITEKELERTTEILTKANKIIHITGSGLEKHHSYDQFYNSLRMLKQIHKATENKKHFIFKKKKRPLIFNNQRLHQALNPKNRLWTMKDLVEHTANRSKHPIEMLWISGANPLNNYGNGAKVKELLHSIPFVVTVDQYFTATAKNSDLILPTTNFFEELDLVINTWDYSLQLNEKAMEPHYESLSEFHLFNELSMRLKLCIPSLNQFPNYESEEEYLNKQWNEDVESTYLIKNVVDLKQDNGYRLADLVYLKNKFAASVPITSAVLPKHFSYLTPCEDYPFWLISTRHALEKSIEKEPMLLVNRGQGEGFLLSSNDCIELENEMGKVQLPIQLDDDVPCNILLYIPSSKPDLEQKINHILNNETFELKSIFSRDIFHTLNDTFVNIKKI